MSYDNWYMQKVSAPIKIICKEEGCSNELISTHEFKTGTCFHCGDGLSHTTREKDRVDILKTWENML